MFGYKEPPEPVIPESISKHDHRWQLNGLDHDSFNTVAIFICECGGFKRVKPLVEVKDESETPEGAKS